jgi:glycerol-3-phosphate dehydrogenase
VEPSTGTPCDLLVVGGGVNGAGIARDAAGRGLSVLLCERDDLAAHTSSASTKLIHGGLRYLEHFKFSLVRKALAERETLLAAAPHIMWPLEFVLPHDSHLRPAWMIRLGLLLYDHLAPRRALPGSRSVDLRQHPAGLSLQPRFQRGFVYADGWVDDARLVVLNAVAARDAGARIQTRTTCHSLEAAGATWVATLRRADGGKERVRARAVVNATGPWAGIFRSEAAGIRDARGLRLIKGSHIVVPSLFDHQFAYIFQTPDRRIVFAIPYEQRFTLIGTTDVEFPDAPVAVAASAAEIAYLCAAASRYFRRPVDQADVVWTFSGLRPLQKDMIADPAGVTRDYELEIDRRDPPLLSVIGGKITTYRRLAEEVVDRIGALLGKPAPGWTGGVSLPGGDLPGGDFNAYLARLVAGRPWADPRMLRRMARAYGSRVERILAGADSSASLGREILPGLHERELEYLRDVEWAQTAADVLWRRSKLGLHLPPGSELLLDQWLAVNGG